MISENDINISNKSYTNKDFVSIYNETLETSSNLSKRFNPTTASETDPIIVNTKMMSAIGDKLCYLSDKAVLERFMPSATQENSMRELCSMMGYEVGYYNSATTTVNITYVGDTDIFNKTGGVKGTFTLKGLETTFTNESGDVTYTLTKDLQIYAKDIVFSGNVIQGYVETLNIAGNSNAIVTLNNIDSNRRLYIPNVNVAQNGIFIYAYNSGLSTNKYWERKENLNVEPLGNTYFKFGFDSEKGFPYIEFPTDISNLIGDGLVVKYIITQGLNGNVSKGDICKITSPSNITVTYSDGVPQTISLVEDSEGNSPLNIYNPYVTTDGADKLTINEAYQEFQKRVGTFNSLVSCRDYANYLYTSLKDAFGNNIVSNVQVADRRTDLIHGRNVVSYDSIGVVTISCTDNTVTAYDLYMYTLNPVNVINKSSYESSFNFKNALTSIKNSLENGDMVGCLSHDYKNPNNTLYLIRNDSKLNATVNTVDKVSAREQADILANINYALMLKFNARELNFGEEVPYDTILSTIENADKRIKSVYLQEPVVSTVLSSYNDNTGASSHNNLLSSASKLDYYNIVARNVWEGHIPLFRYDDRFLYRLGQESTNIYQNEKIIKPRLSVTFPTSSGSSTYLDYQLKNNEGIRLYAPSLFTNQQYSYGINYCLKLDSNGLLNPGEDRVLGSDEFLILEYDADDGQVVKVFKEGDIIQSKTELSTNYSETKSTVITPANKQLIISLLGEEEASGLFSGNNIHTNMLGSQQEVYERICNRNTINSSTYCYWNLNNPSNTIQWSTQSGEGIYVLGNNEYFYYTKDFNSVQSFGAGTMLLRSSPIAGTSDSCERISVEELLLSSSLVDFKNKFININPSANQYLRVTEQEIITLTNGDTISVCYTGTSPTNVTINNSVADIPVDCSVKYKFSGDTNYTVLKSVPSTLGGRKWRAVLSLITDSETYQKLEDDADEGVYAKTQRVDLQTSESATPTTLSSTCLYTDTPIQLSTDLYSDTNISVYSFTLNDSNTATENVNGYYNITADGGTVEKTVSIPNIGSSPIILTVFGNLDGSIAGSYIKLNSASGCTLYNSWDIQNANATALTPPITIADTSTPSGLLQLCIKPNTSTSTLTFTTYNGTKGNIVISPVSVISVDGSGGTTSVLNDRLGVTNPAYSGTDSIKATENLFLTGTIHGKLTSSRAGVDKFFYNYPIDNSKYIEFDSEDERLYSPAIFYKTNNVARNLVLNKVDILNSNIVIGKSSKLK